MHIKQYEEKIHRLKQKKLYTKILILVIIFFLLGILFTAIISKSNKELVKSTMDLFFSQIKKDNLNYFSGFIHSIINNIGISLFIWILGISIIGIPIIALIVSFKAFTLGFSFSSIIYFYGVKGLLLALIYIIPLIINLLITIVISFFSISFSKHLFQLLFQKTDIPIKRIMKRYLKVLGVSAIILLFNVLLECFVVPYLLKYFL